MIKEFIYDEEGMATLEIVIITAVLISLALLFKDAMGDYFKKVIQVIIGN